MVHLRNVCPEDEVVILSWRNSPQVAHFMYRDDPIAEAEHHLWFETVIGGSKSSKFWILERDSQAAGLSSITKIDVRNRSCEWGGYLSPAIDHGEGLGKAMLFLTLYQAFEEHDLNRVVVEVIVDNAPALNLYESMGFVREGMLRERAYQKSGPIDAYVLAMLKSEWADRKLEIERALIERGLIT